MKGRSKRGEKMGVEDAIVEGGSGVGGGASGTAMVGVLLECQRLPFL